MKRALSISAQILLAVLVTAMSVLGFSSMIELNGLKRRETQALQDKGALTADRIANSLAYPLWNLNREETERVVLDEISWTDVSRIQVFDEHDVMYVEKARSAEGPPLYAFSRDVRFKNTRIGRVTLDVTDASLQAALRDLRQGIATKLVVLVVLLSVVLFVALRVLVIRPVSSLKSWVATVPSASAEHALAPRFAYSGEINALAQAFDRMSLDLRRQNEELEKKHAHLRESEERYRTLADTATDAIVTIDHHSTVLFANAAVEKIFGHSPADLIGDRLTTLMPEHLRQVHEASLKRYLNTGTKHVTWDAVELMGLHKSGRAIQLEVSFGEFSKEGTHLFTGIIRDITERKRAETALRNSTTQLRALSARLQSAREEEGTRIAREIHDEMGSSLTGLKWDLERLAENLPAGDDGSWVADARGRIGSMTRLIESTVDVVRRISAELRPGILDDLGLVAAIEWQAQQFQSRTGITYVPDIALEANDVSRDTSTAVFRIFQEILTNIMRHAEAQAFYVKLWEHDGYLALEVRDDGRGITDSERGNMRSLGLLGMKERALLVGGDVSIDGQAGAGTIVIARFPMVANAAAQAPS